MKILIVLGTIVLFGFSLEMPPNPPSIEKKVQASKLENNNIKNKNHAVDECLMIPSGLYLLPPPLENDLYKCQNSFFKPSIETAEKFLSKLTKTKQNIKKVIIMRGFNQLYKIETDNMSYFCNKQVTHCFEAARLLKELNE